jgi:hypothetical protein
MVVHLTEFENAPSRRSIWLDDAHAGDRINAVNRLRNKTHAILGTYAGAATPHREAPAQSRLNGRKRLETRLTRRSNSSRDQAHDSHPALTS